MPQRTVTSRTGEENQGLGSAGTLEVTTLDDPDPRKSLTSLSTSVYFMGHCAPYS